MKGKRENFVRLAEGRVNRALKDIRLIGNLSNRSAYSYSDEDVKKTMHADVAAPTCGSQCHT